MAKKVKKIDVKKVQKEMVMAEVKKSLIDAGFDVLDGEVKFGFTGGTLVIRTAKCDVQLKPITPKAGVDFYEELPEEEDTVEEEKDEPKEKEDAADAAPVDGSAE